MQPSLEQLLADIYTLDTSLREQDVEVRALVEQLLEEKPVVAVDPAFRARLRSELLKKQTAALPTSTPGLPWWLFYAAPIGVAAVLILMLVPEYTKTQAPFVPTAVPTTEQAAPVADEAMFMNAPAEVPSTKRGAGMTSESEMSTFGMEADMAISDSISIGTQEAGRVVLVESAFISMPAYVVVQVVGQSDTVLGMSEILLPGEQLPFAINLQTPLLASDTYEAVVYHDDGDGIKDTLSDMAVSSTFFAVSPR
jgi:hypothetical protein